MPLIKIVKNLNNLLYMVRFFGLSHDSNFLRLGMNSFEQVIQCQWLLIGSKNKPMRIFLLFSFSPPTHPSYKHLSFSFISFPFFSFFYVLSHRSDSFFLYPYSNVAIGSANKKGIWTHAPNKDIEKSRQLIGQSISFRIIT